MAVNSKNVHIFGSDNDTLYLGGVALAGQIKDLAPYAKVPDGLVDCGWLTDDGAALKMDDSSKEIQGHQGHGVVGKYVDKSSTTFTADIMEHKLKIALWNLDGTPSEKKTDPTAPDGAKDYVQIKFKRARGIIHLCGIWDTYDILHDNVKFRYIFPGLDLIERSDYKWSPTDAGTFSYSLELTEDPLLVTTAPSMLPS